MSSTPTTTYLLTGDIGGTNSRMSLYNVVDAKPLVVKTFRNAQHLPESTWSDPSAFQKHIVIPFLEHCWKTAPSLAALEECQIIGCLATAGLVTKNGVQMTNLGGLLVDGSAIANNTSDPYLKRVVVCTIINDFVAQGYGVLTLQPEEVRVLYGPNTTNSKTALDSLPVGPKVCVGAGTGLGECYLTPNNGSGSGDDNTTTTFSCFPSEGGHVEYAPRNALEVEMFEFLSSKFRSKERISVERVVSGTGLANVYDFLAHKYPDRKDPAVHEEFLQAGDEQGRVVAVNANKDDPGSLCTQAINIMMGAYGCEVGSAAIKWIPVGGLFVTGGLTPKNIDRIQGLETQFMKSYLHKGRVSPLLEKIPLFAVMVEDLGVRGAHKAALMEYERFCNSGENKTTTTTTTGSSTETTTTKRDASMPWALAAAATVLGFTAGVFFHKMRR